MKVHAVAILCETVIYILNTVDEIDISATSVR